MTEKEIKAITKNIAISVAKLCQKLPANKVNSTFVDQILRSSASMGANYRVTCRGKSPEDFVYKLLVVEEETDETMFFLELLAEFNEEQRPPMTLIYKDTETVLRIIVASIKTAQRNENKINAQQSKIRNQKSKKNER
jgi:four helix bundle protein